jgi:hypothetical protein
VRGAEEARKLVNAALEAQMVDKVAELGARYGLPPASPPGAPDAPGTLPDVRLFVPGERFAIPVGSWPAIFTTRLSTTKVAVADVDPGGGHVLYRITYRLRVYVYANGQDADDVTDKVDRYTLAVRELLLINLGLDAGAVIDPSSLVESYSGVEPEVNGRHVAAAYIDLDLALEELADRTRPPDTPAAAGDPQVVRAGVTVLPPHPALD